MKTIAFLAWLGALSCPPCCAAQEPLLKLPGRTPISGINTPAVSPDGSQICFSFRGDLWIVPAVGGNARRLTVHPAHDAYPRWSPDGAWIAFASDRYPSASMNYDVFIMPASGGEPRRLTYHTNNDYPFDWSSDGKRLLLQAIRQTDAWQAIELDIATGRTRSLTQGRDLIRYATYSPDNRSIAYTKCGRTANWWRSRYRGSANMDIWLRDLSSGASRPITTYEGMDLWPMFTADGKSLCYVSDVLTPGVPNLVMTSLKEIRPVSLTRYDAGAVLWPNMSRDGSAIAYVYRGSLYLYSVREHVSRKLTVYAESDVARNRVERVAMTSGATELEVAPDAKTLGIVLRGDIWTVPVGGVGEARRMTPEPCHDYDFTWSPDGSRMAFVSDRKGAFGIYTLDVKTRDVRELAVGPEESGSPQWSPDGKNVAYLMSGPNGGLYVIPSDGSSPARKVAASAGNNRFGVGINAYAWSPDSRWLAFSRRDRRNTTDIWVVAAVGGEAINITQYPGSNNSPRWTSDGRYLLFTSSRDRMQGEDLYVVPLQRQKRSATGERQSDGGADAAGEVRIDFEDITLRSQRLTTFGVTAFEVTPDGRNAIGITSFGSGADLFTVPVAGGSVQRISTSGDIVGIPRFAAGASGRFWCLVRDGTVRSFSLQGSGWTSAAVPYEAVMQADRDAERRQAFHEFWRSLKSGFYDPKMHGVDWDRVREDYEARLAGVETAEEFAFFVLAPMAGELNASHAEVSPKVSGDEPEVADLGLRFDEEYPGPGLRVSASVRGGPCNDGGMLVKPGEFVLQIAGNDVVWGERLWQTLAGRAGKETELLVNAEPKADGARTVKVTPVSIGRVRELLYEEEVRRARTQVSRWSEGRIAYLRVAAMDVNSVRRFERELWGEAADAEGLVLDLRDNGGGSTHDAILAQLARTAYGTTKPRDGEESTQPWRVWQKPTVLLVNANSASDAELFAMGFRALKLGPIVGTRTPGYVIGTYTATLQDGTSYRIPMWGWYSLDGRDLENVGVKPDIEAADPDGDLGGEDDAPLRSAVEELLRRLPRP